MALERLKKVASIAGLALATAVIAVGAGAQDRQLYNVGTGGVTGIFWPTGAQVCFLLNRSRESQSHSLRCTVESTGGSVANLRAIRNGDLDMGLAQSNLQFHSYHGSGPFADEGAFDDLRFLMSFTTNMIHVVTRADTDIESFADLRGKRVNTGNPGSGTEATSYMMMGFWDIDPSGDLALDSKLTNREQGPALCDGKIDAFIYPTSVPVAAVTETANTCEIRLISVAGPELDALLAENPFFAPTTIPAGTYAGVDVDIQTFGYASTLLATAALPDEVAYNLVKSSINGIDAIKAQSPAFSTMTRETAANFGQYAPYHPGAEKFYKEAGLID